MPNNPNTLTLNPQETLQHMQGELLTKLNILTTLFEPHVENLMDKNGEQIPLLALDAAFKELSDTAYKVILHDTLKEDYQTRMAKLPNMFLGGILPQAEAVNALTKIFRDNKLNEYDLVEVLDVARRELGFNKPDDGKDLNKVFDEFAQKNENPS